WPAVALHAAWNAVIQGAFDPASGGPLAALWVGEAGGLVAVAMGGAAGALSDGRRAIRRGPRARPEAGAARPVLGQLAAPAMAVMALALATCGCGGHASNAPSMTSHGSVLPRDLIVPLRTVKEVLPEMSRETATGQDETAVGNPTGT